MPEPPRPLAVGHHGEFLRGGDTEGEVRLVRRVVVAREDPVPGVGLVGHGEPVGGPHPAPAVPLARGIAGVADGDAQRHACREVARHLDDQVLVLGREVRAQPVDVDGANGSAGEVEVDPVQRLGRPRVDRGDGVEGVGVAAPVTEADVVGQYVVSGVSEVREERVPDAEGHRCGQGGGDEGGRCGGQQGGPQTAGEERHGLRLPAPHPPYRDGAHRATRTRSAVAEVRGPTGPPIRDTGRTGPWAGATEPSGAVRQSAAAGCWARLTSYTPGTSRMARISAGSPAASGRCRV